jgi:CRISPR-associated endonuclease/helicase Cas3
MIASQACSADWQAGGAFAASSAPRPGPSILRAAGVRAIPPSDSARYLKHDRPVVASAPYDNGEPTAARRNQQFAIASRGWMRYNCPLVEMWAKSYGTDERIPLVAHLIDTAAVAAESWSRCSAQFRQNAVALLAPGNEELARARLAWIAGAHDLGKSESSFQTQWWSKNREEFEDVRRDLENAGFPLALPKYRPAVPDPAALWLRHEAATGLILQHLLSLPAWVRRIAMAHHGRFQPMLAGQVPKELKDHRKQMLADPWHEEQKQLLEALTAAVAQLLGVEDLDLDNWVSDKDLTYGQQSFVFPLAGFVSVCDWIASDVKFTASAPLDVLRSSGPNEYAKARAESVTTVCDATWGTVDSGRSPTGTFSKLFPGKEPRGVQAWIAEQEPIRGLVIVCAEPGQGKTEMALLRHTRDPESTQGASDWLYFGLPTMATADAMFERVQQFWRDVPNIGHLAHGQAALNEFYAPTTATPGNIYDDHSTNGLSPASWFQGRHRSLLAPVTVGTQDQVLAAALRHKYVTVRHAGLANKHLVLDEIHTYDPYQQRLLIRLLEWLGAYHVRVTLLSATLPRARIVELVRAYLKGWNGSPSAAQLDEWCGKLPNPFPYPSVTTASDDRVEVSQTDPWRRFHLSVQSHLIPPETSNNTENYTRAVVELVCQIRKEQPHSRIAVILNTVDRVVRVYQKLACDPAYGKTVVLHSRMTATQRHHYTDMLKMLAGKDAKAGPMLAVTTQVAEASLDLDFDVLVTDLAPIASLFQRSGRLWRHSLTTEHGWTHPDHLAHRNKSNPVMHVLVQTNDDKSLACRSTLPYLSAELLKTWTEPSCLASGQRNTFKIPCDMQAAVDAGNVTWDDLVKLFEAENSAATDGDEDLHAAVVAALGAQAAKQQDAENVALRLEDISAEWSETTSDEARDPFHSFGPDWSGLTWPLLNEATTVTRLQEVEQVRILVCDPEGCNPWAFAGKPQDLMVDSVSPDDIVAAMGATVPVSGQLARALKAKAKADFLDKWRKNAPIMLRHLVPLTVRDFTDVAVLDRKRGLIPVETS